MHWFLTGEIHVGKSTAIKRFLAGTGIRTCGFKTVWVDGDSPGSRRLYLAPYNSLAVSGAVVAQTKDEKLEIYPQRFDERAGELLRQAPDSELMIMDELGFLERHAGVFQREVLARLDEDFPILGVIKPRSTPFLDRIRSHRNVRTITVDENNREAVYVWLCRNIKPLPAGAHNALV